MPTQILNEKEVASTSKVYDSYSLNYPKGLEVTEEFEGPPSPYLVGHHCKSNNGKETDQNPSMTEGNDSSTQPKPTTQSRTPSPSSAANRCNQRRDPSMGSNITSSDPPPSENPNFFAVEASLVPDTPCAVVVAVRLPTSENESESAASNAEPAPPPPYRPFWRRHIGLIIAGIGLLIIIAILIPILLIFVIPSNGGGPTIDSTRDRNEHNSSLIRANKLVQKLETEVLCRGATFQEIDLDDPRRLALDWITNDDEMSLDLDAKNLNQRYILAFSLNWWAWRGDQDGNTEVGIYS